MKRRQDRRRGQREHGMAAEARLSYSSRARSPLMAPVSLSLSTPSQLPFVLLILSSHFTAIAIALLGVGFQSNPRDPCGKVWLFNFLLRFSSSLSLSLSHTFFFYISQDFPFSLFTLHVPLTLPSLILRGHSLFFSAVEGTTVISCRDLYCS